MDILYTPHPPFKISTLVSLMFRMCHAVILQEIQQLKSSRLFRSFRFS